MHYYQFNIGDYRRDTQHLTPLEHGIYRLLLDQYYLTEKPINANAFRPLCIRTAEEIEIAQRMLDEFFTHIGDGNYTHKCCDKIIEAFKEKSEKSRASALARWNANAMRTHSEGNANHKPITNNHKPNKDIGENKVSTIRVPFKDIVDLYHELLPELPKCLMLTKKREGQIRQRWTKDMPDLNNWGNFFRYVKQSDFLMGNIPPNGDRKVFHADLEWLTKESNFAKIYEGKYHG